MNDDYDSCPICGNWSFDTDFRKCWRPECRYEIKDFEKLHLAMADKTICEVRPADNCDCGIEIELYDGTIVTVKYSGCEGTTYLNGEKVNVTN